VVFFFADTLRTAKLSAVHIQTVGFSFICLDCSDKMVPESKESGGTSEFIAQRFKSERSQKYYCIKERRLNESVCLF
jgi:hypothetical protein